MRGPIPRTSSLFAELPQTKSYTGFLPFFFSFLTSLASTLAWKITDVDFATKMGAKHLPEAYGVIAILLIFSGITIAFLRKSRPPERLFIRLQQISWSVFLFLWLIEMQHDISSVPIGIFLLKVLGHVYSSLTLLSFWIMYDPYDPFCRISKNSYTLLLTAAYLGIAFSGFIFNHVPLQGASNFIPLIGSLSFTVWLIANFCHPRADQDSPLKKGEAESSCSKSLKNGASSHTTEKPKKRFSRSTLFLICGSILLNAIAGSSEYSVIANFEAKFFSQEGVSSSAALGQFLTLFGFGNLLALISCAVWYSVRLSPFGLMAIGATALLFAQFSGSIFFWIPLFETSSQAGLSSSIMTAAASLLIVESLYPLVVQSNMMNVLAALPITTQRQARAIIESSAEAIGLAVSAVVIEASSSLGFATIGMCFSLCALSGFLWIKEKRMKNKGIINQHEEHDDIEDVSFDTNEAMIEQNITSDPLEVNLDSLLEEEPLFSLSMLPQNILEPSEHTHDVVAV